MVLWLTRQILLINHGLQRKNGDRIFRYVAQMADQAIYWGSKKNAPAFIYK